MIRAAAFHYVRFTRHFLSASVLVGMNACVTTTTSGFNVEPLDGEFLADYIQLAVRLDQDNSGARNNYAALLFSMGNHENACAELSAVAQDAMYEGRAMAFRNLDRSAVSLNRLEKTEVAFPRALQLNSNLYTSSVKLALLSFQRGDWPGSRQTFRQYLTTTEFFSLPHAPRALLAGITIESRFNNQKLVGDFTRIPKAPHQDSPEYAELKQRMTDAN